MLQQVALIVAESLVEALSDALLAAGALSVSITDADAEHASERPLFGEPGATAPHLAWPRNCVSVLLAPDADPRVVVQEAARTLAIAPPPIAEVRALEDADWVRQTQSQFAPIHVAGRLWIVPTWHLPPEADAINVRLDPGAAFGTGTHPTTQLCLQWLVENISAGQRVLDYGCGSGILAIVAAKLGAREVVGVDLDQQALHTARANSEANSVSARYTIPAALPPGTFDVVLANILANPLLLLAPALIARVRRGGALVLSGVLARQADEMIAAYACAVPALSLALWRRDDWVCLAGRRDT
jgi:ribosomal protein L11 methyltransferase